MVLELGPVYVSDFSEVCRPDHFQIWLTACVAGPFQGFSAQPLANQCGHSHGAPSCCVDWPPFPEAQGSTADLAYSLYL